MASITYIAAGGTESSVDVAPGISLMMGAIQNNIQGIDAECGGCLSCATCHVYVDPRWADRLPAPDDMESEMLDAVAAERRPNSRLSCQVIVTPDFEGMQVLLPELQA
jgi:2Fe-2S ferredoxin